LDLLSRTQVSPAPVNYGNAPFDKANHHSCTALYDALFEICDNMKII
jgi:hypothetical protein